jgi:PiT family inorganic phosphate transporter
VRWGVAGNIVAAWIVTLPAAAAIGALAYAVTRLFGTGAAGPLVVSVLMVLGAVVLFSKRARHGPVVARAEA